MPAAHLISSLRTTLARATRRAPGGGVAHPVPSGSGDREVSALPSSRELRAPAEHPIEAPGRESLRVAAVTSARLRGLLSPEWDDSANLVTPVGSTGMPLALVLLELTSEGVPGWTGDVPGLLAQLTTHRTAGAAVVAWATSGPVPADVDPVLAACDLVAAVDEDLAGALRGRGVAEPVVLPAAAQPRAAGPSGESETTTRRFDAVALPVPAQGLPPVPVTQELAEPALRRLPGRRLVEVVSGPETLPAPDPTLGRVATAVDLGAADPATPWSVLAAAGAGTSLVGLGEPHPGVPSEISALIPRVDGDKDLRSEVGARINQPELADREGHRLFRAVMAGHTAGHRVDSILAALAAGSRGSSLPHRPARASGATVSAVVPTNRPDELDNVLTNLARQDHERVELVLVLHGLRDAPDAEEGALRRRAEELGLEHLTLVHADPDLTLGSCMNLGVEAASGEFVAKMDDDNFYGAAYLSDLLASFDHTDAGIVGKWCHYVWLRSTGAVVLRYPDSEHRYERRVQGGSMLFRGDVVRGVRFSDIPRAVDSDILDRSMEQGVRVYSSDRYNYVSIRGTDRMAHTWTVPDSTFMTTTGRLSFYGDPREHVSV